MNFADIAVMILVAALIAAAIVIMYRNKKKGKRGCGCDCSHCTGCGVSDSVGFETERASLSAKSPESSEEL